MTISPPSNAQAGSPRSGAFADLIEAFHGVFRQSLHLRADSDGILAAFRLRAVKEARSARSCDRCCPGDRLVGAQRRDATGLFVVWIFAFHGGRDRRRLSSVRRFLLRIRAQQTKSRRGRPFRCGRSLLPLWSRFFRRATMLPKSPDDVVWLAAAARAPRRNRCPVSARV